MQTQLAPEFQNTPDGQQAEAILRKCVHCGFCTATCPTYQLLGDELDGPRGRIYLIKQVLEGQTPTRKTQLHLDRCLTCRNCETTCPSGVQYGHLVDIGRKIVDEQVPRPMGEKLQRWLLKEGMTSPLFAPALKAGRAIKGLLPVSLAEKIPAAQDAWVGLFVLIGALALVFLGLQSANLLSLNFEKTYPVTARFDNIGGLKAKAAVKSAGVVVGRVESITFNDQTFQADVAMNMENRYAFPKDSSLKILTSGLLGDQYIGIEAGASEENLKAGDRVTATQSAVVLENLIGQFLYGKAEQGGDSGGSATNGGAKE